MKASWKAWLFLLSLSLIFVLGGRLLGDRQGLMLGFLIAVFLNILLFWLGDRLLIRSFESQALEGQDPWGVLQILTKITRRYRITTPQVRVIPDPCPVSFAIGTRPQRATIVLSEGLLEKFDKAELKSILLYHCIAIQREETRLPSLVAALFGGILLMGMARSLDRFLGWTPFFASQKSHLMETLLAPILLFVMRMILNPDAYIALDRLTKEEMGDPKPLATALWKMESYRSSLGFSVAAPLGPLFMVNPLTANQSRRCFHFQPPTERRIRQIVGYYPI